MTHFVVEIERSPDNYQIVKEFNKRINGGNAIFIIFQGKASLLLKGDKQHIFFNIRVYPLEPPFYSFVLYRMFKRMLKKEGHKLVVNKLSTKQMEELLEAYL